MIGPDEHSLDSSANCSRFGAGEDDLPATSRQRENLSWWQRNPMTYNWNETAMPPEGSRDFFLEIDRRFFTSSPFFQGTPPFSALIPLDRLGGRDVLEIGCGMGSHAQLLAEAGCHLTAIDLTPRAVEMTARRLMLNGLTAEVRVMDAERMDFPDASFDFVWSWGVIHHSANTERAVREVYRVLRSPGEFRCMVYHRHSLDAVQKLLRGALSGKVCTGMSVPEILDAYTDGWIARHYTRSELSALMESAGFDRVATRLLGQRAELVPLPGRGRLGPLKSYLVARLPDAAVQAVAGRVGSYLFATATKGAGADAE